MTKVFLDWIIHFMIIVVCSFCPAEEYPDNRSNIVWDIFLGFWTKQYVNSEYMKQITLPNINGLCLQSEVKNRTKRLILVDNAFLTILTWHMVHFVHKWKEKLLCHSELLAFRKNKQLVSQGHVLRFTF